MYRITSNPSINSFYFKGRYLYPYGNSPAIDLTGGCEIQQDVDFLLLACGDIRNILFTLKTLDDLKIKPKTLSFHVNDIADVILARNLVLFAILDKIDPEENEDINFLWSVWYDMAISRESLQKVRHVIEELIQHGHPRVTFMTQECNGEIKNVLNYWLKRKFSLKRIEHRRNAEFEERLVNAKETEKNIIPFALYGDAHYRNWAQEVGYFVETGSTHRGEHMQRLDGLVANPTLICPHVDGWRVHPSGTPFHSYKLLGLTEGKSLFENCLSQLKKMVRAWKKCIATNSPCLTVSFWLGDCLTLCNQALQSDVKFDFIHTSNIQDHVGLLNLLASCSGRLKSSGVLITETLLWANKFSSVQEYLNASIGIPPTYFPTVLGLRLAEDFTMGTSEPRSVFMHAGSEMVTIRWLETGKEAERISIYDSIDLLKIFRGLVQSCMPFHIPPSYACVKMPSTLVQIVRIMKDNIVGGAKTLLDIITDAQPRLQTACGEVFHPHEISLRVTWLAYRDEFGLSMLKDQEEAEILIFGIQAQPPQDAEMGIGALYIGKIYMNVLDSLSWVEKLISPSVPWHFLTSIAYDMTGTITFLLPSKVWNSLNNSASLSISSNFYDLCPVFVSMSIKNDSRVQIMGRMPVSCKPVPVRHIGKCLTVKEDENRYEIHMKLQESFQNSPNFKVELGSDPTEVIIKSDKFSSTHRFLCPLQDVHTDLILNENTLQITAEKNLGVLMGPLILKYRRLDIEHYPSEGNITTKLATLLASNKIYQERKTRDDHCRNISSHVFNMLQWATKLTPSKLLFRALFIIVRERNPGERFGHNLEDIFIVYDKCHIIDEKVVLNLVWTDFERVNQYIKEGRITRMEVDTYCLMLGLLSGDQLQVTKTEALLLRKWLKLNTMKSQQWQEDHKYQWRFNSFLQPLYAIVGMIYQRLVESFTESPRICSNCKQHSADLKACKRCRSVVYCGKQCQKDDWTNHRITCLSNKEFKGGLPTATDKLRTSEKACSCCLRRCPDLKTCKRCQAAVYCGKECQEKDWPNHKQSCTVDMHKSTSHSSATKRLEKPENVCSSCSRKAPNMKCCARCQSAFYCNRVCQTRDWRNHKQICKA